MTINPNEVEIYFYNTGSNWFPKLNGVELKHTVTGIQTRCGSERSEHKNKDIAWKELELKVEAFKPLLIQQMDSKMMVSTLRDLADLLESKAYSYVSGGMIITEHHFTKETEIKSDLVLRKI